MAQQVTVTGREIGNFQKTDPAGRVPSRSLHHPIGAAAFSTGKALTPSNCLSRVVHRVAGGDWENCSA